MTEEPLGWFAFAGQLFAGQSLLYVGPNYDRGLERLGECAGALSCKSLTNGGRDLISNPAEAQRFDVVVSLGALEQVDDGAGFVQWLCQTARRQVLVGAANTVLFRTPSEAAGQSHSLRRFYDLVVPHGRLSFYKGTARGEVIQPVHHIGWYLMLHDFLNNEISHYPTRAFESLLPHPARSYAQTICLIDLKD